jgi:hypothetical protein
MNYEPATFPPPFFLTIFLVHYGIPGSSGPFNGCIVMKTKNNLVVTCSIALLMFLCAIPINWFTLYNATSSFGGILPTLTANGINGTITLLTVQLPIWLLLVICCCATAITMLNTLGVTTIPRIVPALVLLVCGAFYATLFCYAALQSGHDDGPHTVLAGGPFVAMADTLLVLAITALTSRSGENFVTGYRQAARR